MIDDKDLLEEIELEVAELSDEDLTAEATRILAAKEKRKSYRQKGAITPEQAEKRKLYRKRRYERDKLIEKLARERGIITEEEPTTEAEPGASEEVDEFKDE